MRIRLLAPTIALALALLAPAAGRAHAIPHRSLSTLSARVSFLEGAVAHDRYVCRQGNPRLAATRWHCRASRAATGELRAARLALWRSLPSPADWGTAVRVAQRVFPGTGPWLLSCSGAEGAHGVWVRYGGGPYYAGYEQTDAVGGWMQFRPSTFRPYVRRAIEYARAHGFRVPLPAAGPWLGSWRDPLGQALAAGYMRAVARNTSWHWSASLSHGCA